MAKKNVNTTELGTPGLMQMGGVITEEWNRTLTGSRARKLYKEMRDNDPIVGATFFVIEMLLLNVTWNIVPAKTSKGKKAAEFLDSIMEDMDETWTDTISEILSMLQYGWSYCEVVYKKRDDGKVGIKKIALRGQNTLDRWEFDGTDVVGMWQSPLMVGIPGKSVYIPKAKALHFKTRSYKSNPEGRSILRSVVRTYNFKKHVEDIEAIGIERDLSGLPVMRVPFDYLDVNATAERKAQLAHFQTVVSEVKRNKRAGLVLPAKSIGNELTGFDFELLTSGGKRQVDTNAIITRYDQRIAMAMLAQFILLGSGGSGSYALADTQTNMFTIALQAFLTNIAEALNKQLIPTLMGINGFAKKDYPKFQPEQLTSVSLNTVGQFINQMVASNVIQPDEELEHKVRRMADLPEKGEPREQPKNPHNAGRPSEDDILDRDSSVQNIEDTENKANVRTEKEE